MSHDSDAPRSVRGFKLLTIVGCLGTLGFLGAEGYRENFGGEYRHWQEVYAAGLDPSFRDAFELGIKQAFLTELGRVDRCQSCHVAVDDRSHLSAPQPLTTHPGTLLADHPPEDFGCTICHQGQGRALTLADAHGRVPHWEEPLLDGELVYTSCGRCHPENGLFGHEAEVFRTAAFEREIHGVELSRSVPGASLLARGKELVATSGCLGCHEYRGIGGSLGPDLTHVGDKGIHGYDFSHLPEGVERTPLEWLVAHFMDPGAVSPGTVMPEVGTGREDAEALAAYMLSLRTQDVPARYRPAPPSSSDELGEVLTGAELYELFCIACHGSDLAGGRVPEIRTPGLSNQDFLAVADDAYLRYIVEHGRSGTEMPAWGAEGGGLSSAQVGRIVDYIRSFEPREADPDEVLALRGDARHGRNLYRGNCAGCHGLSGEGGVGTRLASPDFLGMVSDEFLVRTIVEGRPGTGMPSWRGLSSQMVADLVSHLRTWQQGGADPERVLAYLEAGAADPRMGETLFRSRCSACHGAEAGGAIGPSLNHENFLALVPDSYLVHSILEGRPGTAMPAWLDLAPEDVGDLVAHLRTLSDVEPRVPRPLVAQGDAANGELLFARICASCHGQDAVGGLGPQLRNPAFLGQATDGFLFQTIGLGRHGTPMRGFLRLDDGGYDRSGIAELGPAQVADIVAWLRSLEHAGPTEAWRHPVLGSASRGREIYEGTGSCAKCHGFQGEGGVGPALGNPWFLERATEGFLLGTLVRGRPGTEMRRFVRDGIADLSPEALMDVAAYVRGLGEALPEGRAGWRTFQATEDRVAVGAELYRGYCASCHGSDGRGGYAPELNNPEFLHAASDGHLVATIARGRTGTPMRPFGAGPASMAQLDHEEIRALVAFLRSWESPSSKEN